MEPPRTGVVVTAPVETAATDERPARIRRGELYRPPRWWQRLRSIVLLVIVTTLVGATVAAIVGALLALIGIGVREAVS